MTDPLPINIAGIEAKAAQAEAKQAFARQVNARARIDEEVEEQGFNPNAARKLQERMNRSRPLETRRRTDISQQAIKEINKRSEEDLARNFQRRNPELPADKLMRLRQVIRTATNAEEILNEVLDSFRDPTLADEALEFLEKATDSPTVREARALLNETKRREIIAGRNVDEAAKSFHQKGIGESPTELRDLYRDITGNPRDHNVLFSELAKQYPFDQLKLVVAFLLKGLGYDLKSKGPSIQHAELIRLMTETRNLQSILWVYLYFKSRMRLMRLLYSQYGKSLSKGLSFELLAKEFIRLVEEKYPSVLKLIKQGDQIGLDDIDKLIVFLQFRDAVRALSPRLYRSIKHRQDLLLIILEAIEELEEEEEEEEENHKKRGQKPPEKKRKTKS